MKNKYFVWHERDEDGKELDENKKKREIYDGRRAFSTLEQALKYSFSVLHEKPIVAKAYALEAEGKEQVKDPRKPYVIAAYFEDKYCHHWYDGSTDPAPTHEIVRCTKSRLESVLAEIAEESPDKLYWGLELKLIPSLEMFK